MFYLFSSFDQLSGLRQEIDSLSAPKELDQDLTLQSFANLYRDNKAWFSSWYKFKRRIAKRKDDIIRASLIGVAVGLTSLFVIIPGTLKEFPTGSWAPITVVFVADIYNERGTFQVSLNRIVGTLFGGMLGFIGAWVGYSATPLVFLFSFLISLGSGFVRKSNEWSYAGLVCAFTAQAVLYSGDITSSKFGLEDFVFKRIFLNLVGVFALILASLCWPISARQSLLNKGSSALETFRIANKRMLDYFQFVVVSNIPKYEPHQLNDLLAQLEASLASQREYLGLAQGEPSLWREKFPVERYTAFISAQQILLEHLTSLKPLFRIPISDIEHQTQYLSAQLCELQAHLNVILRDICSTFALQAHTKLTTAPHIGLSSKTGTFQLSSTPVLTFVSLQLLEERACCVVRRHIIKDFVSNQNFSLPNQRILPFFAFMTSIRHIVSAIDLLWAESLELCSQLQHGIYSL